MKKLGFIALAALLSCFLLSSPVQAGYSVDASVGGQANSGQNYVTFDALQYNESAKTWSENGLTLKLEPDAKLVTGSVSGQYAAPYLSGNNANHFNNTATGPDQTQYVTSGKQGSANPNASVTMTFDTEQRYFGLLWGSVDPYNNPLGYNKLTFYDSTGKELFFVSSKDLPPPAIGDQGAGGTVYANIYSSTGFTKVVATSSQYAFEFDNVAYGATVPEPAAMLVWGFLCLVGLGVIRRRRTR